MAQRKTFNVSLRPEERLAIEYLHAKYPDQFDAQADVVKQLIRERMVREFGPEWRDQLASNGRKPEAVAA